MQLTSPVERWANSQLETFCVCGYPVMGCRETSQPYIMVPADEPEIHYTRASGPRRFQIRERGIILICPRCGARNRFEPSGSSASYHGQRKRNIDKREGRSAARMEEPARKRVTYDPTFEIDPTSEPEVLATDMSDPTSEPEVLATDMSDPDLSQVNSAKGVVQTVEKKTGSDRGGWFAVGETCETCELF